MKKYMLESVRVGISNGGICCGPVDGTVDVETCVRALDDGKVTYHTLSEMDGFPSIYVTEERIYDDLIEEDYENREFWAHLNDREDCYGFDGYMDFYENLDNHEVPEAWENIWRYLAYMARADWDATNKMKEFSVGKTFGEFEIPMCDVEQEYLYKTKGEEYIGKLIKGYCGYDGQEKLVMKGALYEHKNDPQTILYGETDGEKIEYTRVGNTEEDALRFLYNQQGYIKHMLEEQKISRITEISHDGAEMDVTEQFKSNE